MTQCHMLQRPLKTGNRKIIYTDVLRIKGNKYLYDKYKDKTIPNNTKNKYLIE